MEGLDILVLVVRQGMMPVGAGILIGVATTGIVLSADVRNSGIGMSSTRSAASGRRCLTLPSAVRGGLPT